MRNLLNIFSVIFAVVILLVLTVKPASATFQLPHVTICHVPSNPDQTLSVSIAALGGHLGHGDSLGPCSEPSPSPTPTPSPVPCEEPYIDGGNGQCILDCSQEADTHWDEEAQDCLPNEEEATPGGQPLSQGAEGCSEDCGGESHPNECVITPPKPAVNLNYQKIDGGWKLIWSPTTDTSDFQILKYGYSPDNLEYGIPNLPKEAFEVDIYGLTKTPFWFQIGSDHQNCVSWSEIKDPA